LSAAYALGTVIFYSFIYTLILKPRTHYNIVIGEDVSWSENVNIGPGTLRTKIKVPRASNEIMVYKVTPVGCEIVEFEVKETIIDSIGNIIGREDEKSIIISIQIIYESPMN